MYLLVDSKNRISNSLNSSDFYVNCDQLNDSRKFSQLRIVRVQIPGSFYNVNSTNNILYVSQVDASGMGQPVETIYTIILTKGNYNIQNLALNIQALVRDQTQLVDFTVTYSDITGKLTFTTALADYTFSFLGGVGYLNNILDVIGFDDTNTTVGQSITGRYMVDFTGTGNFYIRLNTSQGNVYSDATDGWTDICAVVPASEVPFQNVNYQAIRPFAIPTYGFAGLHIRLTDVQNRLIDLNGHDWQMDIELT